MARVPMLTALLVLFAVGQQSHAFYYIKYTLPASSVAARATEELVDTKMAVFFREEALRVRQSLPFRFPRR
uniref:Inhibitor I9 domain-containing protein n=1 Tax=Setaria viridis TaxID=4556 RepID=A0A4U6UHV0_SETVI|nr:hypothetical protein SEVIR_6G102714v2 [Setaria viridis]